MNLSTLFAICILHAASAAPEKRITSSFIAPPKPRHGRFKPAKDLHFLLLRGGQQTTSTSQKAHLDTSLFTTSPTIQYNSIIGCVNLLGLGISLAFPRVQYHLDLLGTGAFAMAAMFTVWNGGDALDMPLRSQVSSVAVVLWSVKLASFLFFRACKVKTDARLDELLSTASGAISFWVVSLFWGVIASLPHSLGVGSSNLGNQTSLIVGTIIYTTGLLTESLADYQKWMWKKQNPNRFCKSGLWAISQHPNFFGNLLIWTGITVMNVPALIEPMDSDGSSLVTKTVALVWACRYAIVALVSPAFLWLLFSGQAKGVITPALEQSLKRYGDDSEFREYIDSVPLIVPDFKKILFGQRYGS